MKKSDMICAFCDYYAAGKSPTKRKDVPAAGECRRNPPSVIQTEILEISAQPVFDDTVSMMAPLRHRVIQPVFPQVNRDFWCGDGRWSAEDGSHLFWGQWDHEDE